MAKLYPPSIEGKLLAFAGNTLKVPLTMNRAVSMTEVYGMSVMIKTVQTATLKGVFEGALTFESATGKYYAVFNLENFTPNLGQYYKIQLAYVDKQGEIGYYSSVGVIKYTSYPELTIPSLKDNYYGGYSYTGIYSQQDNQDVKRDKTEKIYSYCFTLTDYNNNLISTSGVRLHDSSNDDANLLTSSDSWNNNMELEPNKTYYLTYSVTTMNGLEASSPRYILVGQDSIDLDISSVLIAEMNYDDGCIQLFLCPVGVDRIKINGSFILSRASSLDNFTTWNEIYRFNYINKSFEANKSILLWEDFTVQQGIKYKYAIQAYNPHGLYSNRLLNVDNVEDKNPIEVLADFEDAFLYDGERQLKIRFNPKVSSFKTTILENKTDTIGSKYPFIFRNGNVNYKEFSISGLISLLGDSTERFMQGIQSAKLFPNRKTTSSQDNPADFQDTSLTSNNIFRERQFKLEVLDWLNNGKTKLFRSPTEGNYIVRLMNTSLSPIDTLGRMLHSFQSSAYEIADCNFENLINQNLILIPEVNNKVLKVGQILPREVITAAADYPDFKVQGNTIAFPAAFNINITEATPGTMISLNYADNQNVIQVQIGGTGAYYPQIENQPLISVSLISGSWDDAKITFTYYDEAPAQFFNGVAKLFISDEIRQVIGNNFRNNVLEDIEDIRRDIKTFHYIKILQRHQERIYKNGNKYYYNMKEENGTKIYNSEITDWNPLVIYVDYENGQFFDGNINKEMSEPDYRFALNDDNYIYLGGRENNTSDIWGDTTGRIDALYDVGEVEKMYVGSGLIVEMAYRVQTIEYVVETTNSEVAKAKQAWMLELETLKNHPSNDSQYEKVQQAYKNFIIKLEAARG